MVVLCIVAIPHPATMRTIFSPSVLKEGLYDQVVLRNHSPSMLFIESEEIESPMAAIGKVPPLQLKEGIPWHRLIVCQSVGKAYLKLEVSQAICDVSYPLFTFFSMRHRFSPFFRWFSRSGSNLSNRSQALPYSSMSLSKYISKAKQPLLINSRSPSIISASE